MARRFFIVSLLLFAVGCGEGWTLDYGKPAAQFLSSSIPADMEQYEGRKVSVKGVVTSIDTGDPENVWLDLGQGIRCNFRGFEAMATQHAVGDEVIIDGIVRTGGDAKLVLDPAISRDMSAPFKPQ